MKPRMFFLTSLLVVTMAIAKAQDSKAPGTLRGKVRLTVKGIKLRDLGPLVVYLDAVRGKLKYSTPSNKPVIGQKNAKFTPSFLIVAAGQTVDFPNNDKIDHNVFSFSKPNSFDLGIYPKGKSKSKTFEASGIVKLYCSIHSSMKGTIFVAPSPYHTQTDASGSFEIRDVPAGRYRLKTWNSKLPTGSRKIKIKSGEVTDAELAIGP